MLLIFLFLLIIVILSIIVVIVVIVLTVLLVLVVPTVLIVLIVIFVTIVPIVLIVIIVLIVLIVIFVNTVIIIIIALSFGAESSHFKPSGESLLWPPKEAEADVFARCLARKLGRASARARKLYALDSAKNCHTPESAFFSGLRSERNHRHGFGVNDTLFMIGSLQEFVMLSAEATRTLRRFSETNKVNRWSCLTALPPEKAP